MREGKETEDVKEVTQGVREVELEDIKETDAENLAEVATVPLPDSPTPEAQADTPEVEAVAEKSSPIDGSDSIESQEGSKEESEGEATVVDAEEPTSEAAAKVAEAVAALAAVAELPQKEAEVEAADEDSSDDELTHDAEKEHASDKFTEVAAVVTA